MILKFSILKFDSANFRFGFYVLRGRSKHANPRTVRQTAVMEVVLAIQGKDYVLTYRPLRL